MKSLFIEFVRAIQRSSVRQQMNGQSLPNDVDVIYDINYANDKNKRHVLDIIRPKDKNEKLPVIVSFHGGAFVGGEKWYNLEHSMKLSREGFVFINVEYTRVPEKDLFGVVKDGFLALKWIKENAEKYNYDLSRLSLIGDSAGSWLIMLIALVNKHKHLQAIYNVEPLDLEFKSLGLISPVADIEKAMKAPCHIFWFKPYVYKFGSKRRHPYNMTSIQDILKDNDLPPCYILTSKGDSYYYSFSLDLKNLFNKVKQKFVYDEYENGERILEHCFNIMHPDYPESIESNNKLLNFIKSSFN